MIFQSGVEPLPLSDVKCLNARHTNKLQKLSDGGGLQLWVQPTGSRLWRLAYRFGGKQKLLALGAYPTVTPAEAGRARDEAKRLLAKGIDPLQAKKEEKQATTPEDTFRVIAEEYVARPEKEGRADATITKTKWLLDFAYPTLGHLSVKEIDPPAVLKVLRHVEARGRHERARRLGSTIATVFRNAIATARAE